MPKARGSKRAQVVIEIAQATGEPLDEHQLHVIRGACLTIGRPPRWAATEVGINEPRQNGKGSILQPRELAGVLEFGEKLVVHSAHEFKTSSEAFLRMEQALESAGLQRELISGNRRSGIKRSHGEEGFEFKNGGRIRYATRTKSGGRGLTGDLIVLDEAMILPAAALRALFMTISARTIHGDPQVWYAGSAVDQEMHEHGHVFSRVRRRGIAGSPGLAYFEWSAEAEMNDLGRVLDDREQWRKANPALGIRISEEHVAQERDSLDARSFAVERLGVGDWPSGEEASALIEFEDWDALTDRLSMISGELCLAFDVTPQRDRAAICAAGRRLDGLLHLEVVDARRGTGWLPERIAELMARHDVHSISCDKGSPAASMIRPLKNLQVEVDELGMHEYAAACGLVFDLIEQQGFRHLGTDELAIAVKNASSRPLGDAWAWSRKLSAADISPLVAGTIALYQASEKLGSVYDTRGLLAV